MKLFYTSLIALFLCISLYGQESNSFFIPDSLQQVSYEELIKQYNIYKNNIPKKANTYAKTLVALADKSNDITKQSNAWYSLAYTYNNLGEYDKAITTIEKAAVLAKVNHDTTLQLRIVTLKGNIYGYKGAYKNALDQYLESKKLAESLNRNYDILIASHNIGYIKKQINDLSGALEVFLKNYNTLEQIPELHPNEKQLFTITLLSIGDTYLRLKDYDNASAYTTIGIEKSKLYNHKNVLSSLLLNKGIILYNQKKYNSAISTLEETTTAILKQGNNNQLVTPYLYLGKCYYDTKDYNKSISYLTKIEQLTSANHFSVPELAEVYILLSKNYQYIKDIHKAHNYLNKHVEFNSKMQSTNQELLNNIYVKYDIANLKKELEQAIIKLEQEKKDYNILKIILGIALIILAVSFWIYYYKQQQNKKKFQALIRTIELLEKKPKLSEKEPTKVIDKYLTPTPNIVPEETEEEEKDVVDDSLSQILDALDVFEQNEWFLSNECSLSYTAKKLNTNTSYLSKVINQYKEKTFSAYITELRINSSLIKLKNDAKLRSYTIKAISEEFGFKRPETFSRAFKAQTGFYPSYYIKNIEQQQVN